jgi:hypothetical protein
LVPGPPPHIPGSEPFLPGPERFIPGPEPLLPGPERLLPGPPPLIPGSERLLPGPPPLIPGSERLLPGPQPLLYRPQWLLSRPQRLGLHPKPFNFRPFSSKTSHFRLKHRFQPLKVAMQAGKTGSPLPAGCGFEAGPRFRPQAGHYMARTACVAERLDDNSPAFQCRVKSPKTPSPEGTTGQMPHRTRRPCLWK